MKADGWMKELEGSLGGTTFSIRRLLWLEFVSLRNCTNFLSSTALDSRR